jgi:hypothetical protein
VEPSSQVLNEEFTGGSFASPKLCTRLFRPSPDCFVDPVFNQVVILRRARRPLFSPLFLSTLTSSDWPLPGHSSLFLTGCYFTTILLSYHQPRPTLTLPCSIFMPQLGSPFGSFFQPFSFDPFSFKVSYLTATILFWTTSLCCAQPVLICSSQPHPACTLICSCFVLLNRPELVVLRPFLQTLFSFMVTFKPKVCSVLGQLAACLL